MFARNHLSSDFRPKNATSWNSEHGLEFNILLDVAPMVLLQPVVQYFANAGGGSQSAAVAGIQSEGGVLVGGAEAC